MSEAGESDVEDPFAHRQEPVVPGFVVGRQATDFLSHELGFARVVEHVAIVEPDAVERVNGPQVHIVGEPPPAQLPQLFEQERSRDHCGTRVEREPVLREHAGPAARLVQPLENGHPVAACSEAHGRGKPAEAGPDHHRVRSTVVVRVHANPLVARPTLPSPHVPAQCTVCRGASQTGAVIRRTFAGVMSFG